MLKIAFTQYGIKEFPGDENNPEVLKYFKAIGKEYSDATAWCSAFMNYCAKEAGKEMSNALNARSWLKVGVSLAKPVLGCVTVLWRIDPKDWRGHVALYVNHDEKYVYLLGGNQNNTVCIKAYDKNRILSYRLLDFSRDV